MFDLDLSLAVQNRMKSHINVSQCWANALKCVTLDQSLMDCLYIEGWAAVDSKDGNPPMTIEHGWIETLDGKIIDPTFAGQDLIIEYFAGLKYDAKERAKLRRKTRELPFVWQFHGWGGADSPEYSAAFNQAMDFSKGKI